ncbi:hypothetical protein E1211_31275 [Micromonospora sp. 15K316]|uniref:hypothetical protein n=1 Tax=Micromonospora sp. 15K316 TaxID=2530376 RepID=UPI001043AC99|nr:hypothetical protein [Micromonospora sp. 15K316]TDC25052.1 hypothetical protein E1211_31275 [Micromonospora sp. 15K316]
MSYTEQERRQWIQRLRDAAIEATCAGADDTDLRDALTEGVAEGRRLLALRAPTVPAPRRDAARPQVTPESGSALGRLSAAVGI